MNCNIINGPNLNLLGKREIGIYGKEDFKGYLVKLKEKFPSIKLAYFQSNVEGEIINEIQRSSGNYDGILLNAGGYTHTSVAIADAVAAIETEVIEVHISNIMNREVFRQSSIIAANCIGTISGFGMKSYDLALQYFLEKK